MFVEINNKTKNISVGDIVINSECTMIGICSELYTNDNAMDVFIIFSSVKQDVYCLYTTYNVSIEDWSIFEGDIKLSNK